jgi:3-deoxy-D-manno-octulosonic-acid transferase
MIRLYNLALPALKMLARLAGLFNAKVRSGLRGRRELMQQLRPHYTSLTGSPRIIVHSASFGELEQAKPVIAALRQKYPKAHLHVTFFSPSGYENAVGKLCGVDVVSYLPEDTAHDIRAFLDLVRPDLVLFARYDVWPNLARELDRRQIPSIVFSATAAVGSRRMTGLTRSLHRTVYRCVSRILAVTESDAQAFRELGVDPDRIDVAGDTRFDQVLARQQATDPSTILPAIVAKRIEERGTLVFVVGSSWSGDEKTIAPMLRLALERRDNILTIIVPHEPSDAHVNALLKAYGNQAIRFSKLAAYNREPIIVVDSIGKLFGLYGIADIAMVGGGFGTGVHNVLEAAVWCAPVIFGPKHERSVEARELIDRTAGFEVAGHREFDFVFWRLANDAELREEAGRAAERYVRERTGATEKVVGACGELLTRS